MTNENKELIEKINEILKSKKSIIKHIDLINEILKQGKVTLIYIPSI